ncbi:MAG: hypothetical protein R3181_05885 [Rubricoccaceae bacterium]|nr:hypothetical protein [Rubricoccaceae bacterium]
MATDSTGVIATLGAWRDRTTDRLQARAQGRLARAARLALTAGIVAVLAVQLTRVGWQAILDALPTHPLFYLLLGGVYVLLPVTETLIYRPLWPLPPRALFWACARKRVLNEEVIGYSGEVSLYLWGAARGLDAGHAFRVVRDVNIVSSVVSFTVAGLLVGAMVGLGELDTAGWVAGRGLPILAGLVLLVGLGVLVVRFRHYVFALPRRAAARVAALHLARHALTNAGLIGMWHLAQPSVGLPVWLTFAAVLVVIERLPFVPSKDLVFVGAGVGLSGGLAVAEAAIAGMLLVQSAGFKALHLLAYLLASSSLGREGEAAP